MTRVRVAIVGAGLMGTWHARYARRAGGSVVAIVDPDRAAAASLQREFPSARVLSGLPSVLDGIDAVHICTPAATHVELTEHVLRAGRHALVEKPLGSTAAEAARLVALAGAGGLMLAPVHQLPFQRGLRRLVADRSRLGDLVHVAWATASAGGEGRSGAARQTLLLEILRHGSSLFRALGVTVPPEAWLILDSSSDDLALTATHCRTRLEISISLRERPRRNELLVKGTLATGYADLFHGFAVVERGGLSRADKAIAPFRNGLARLAEASGNLAWRAWRREPAYPGLRSLIEAFYRSVREGAPPPISAEEIVEAAALMEHLAAPRG